MEKKENLKKILKDTAYEIQKLLSKDEEMSWSENQIYIKIPSQK